MERYEVLILTIPEITSDETSVLEKEFEKVIQKISGTVLSFERWGKLRLAYPIKHNEYGVYFLTRFDVDASKKRELNDQLAALLSVKYNTLVTRFMLVHLDSDAPLAYHRPESLEEAPSQDVNKFLRENKMESLLSSVSDKEDGDLTASGVSEEELYDEQEG